MPSRAVAYCLLLSALACDRSEKPEQAQAPAPSRAAPPTARSAPPAPKPQRPAEPLNVILLSVDSLRADMPWAGYERPIAPNLTQLAAQGIVYENARSVASYTAQSVAVFLSGRYASTLYRQGVFFTGYPDSNLFFPEVLRDAGLPALGAHAHMYFHRGKGIDQGFSAWEIVKGISFDSSTDNHVTSEKLTALLAELLSKPEHTKQPFFAWAHYMDPHDQYQRHAMCPKEWGRSNRDRYDCEVLFTDHHIGEFLKFAEKQPWWERTAVIVTADHGEAFGEHDMWKHAFELWEVLVRVPWLFKVPGAEPRRIDAPRTHIDMAPTIVDLMGIEPLPGFMGKSLVPELFGAPAPQRDVIVLELAEDSHNPARRAIIQGDYKLIVHGYKQGYRQELYDLGKDPGETRDIAKEEPEALTRMRALFEETFAKIPSIEPYGGMTLKSGRTARGPVGPPAPKATTPEETDAREAAPQAGGDKQ
ncbi:MAG TPA: sulfatase [Polyangiaceae bacterium]